MIKYRYQNENTVTIMSISGGKDSLAMWLLLHKLGVKNLLAVYFNGGWDWECAEEEIKRMEFITGINCKILRPKKDFNELISRYGWPKWKSRWCTSLKRDTMTKYYNKIRKLYHNSDVLQAVGLTVDEKDRHKRNNYIDMNIVLPLRDYKITGEMALSMCSRAGLTWDGHYMRRGRISCWTCPFQRINDLRELYFYHPAKWEIMEKMDLKVPKKRNFRWASSSLADLRKRFDKEKKSGIF